MDTNTEEEHIQELKEKLRIYDLLEEDLDEVINDVNEIVTQRALKAYFEELDNPEINQALQSLSGQELVDYFTVHAPTLPPLSPELLKKNAEETWADYFQFMDEHKNGSL